MEGTREIKTGERQQFSLKAQSNQFFNSVGAFPSTQPPTHTRDLKNRSINAITSTTSASTLFQQSQQLQSSSPIMGQQIGAEQQHAMQMLVRASSEQDHLAAYLLGVIRGLSNDKITEQELCAKEMKVLRTRQTHQKHPLLKNLKSICRKIQDPLQRITLIAHYLEALSTVLKEGDPIDAIYQECSSKVCSEFQKLSASIVQKMTSDDAPCISSQQKAARLSHLLLILDRFKAIIPRDSAGHSMAFHLNSKIDSLQMDCYAPLYRHLVAAIKESFLNALQKEKAAILPLLNRFFVMFSKQDEGEAFAIGKELFVEGELFLKYQASPYELIDLACLFFSDSRLNESFGARVKALLKTQTSSNQFTAEIAKALHRLLLDRGQLKEMSSPADQMMLMQWLFQHLDSTHGEERKSYFGKLFSMIFEHREAHLEQKYATFLRTESLTLQQKIELRKLVRQKIENGKKKEKEILYVLLEEQNLFSLFSEGIEKFRLHLLFLTELVKEGLLNEKWIALCAQVIAQINGNTIQEAFSQLITNGRIAHFKDHSMRFRLQCALAERLLQEKTVPIESQLEVLKGVELSHQDLLSAERFIELVCKIVSKHSLPKFQTDHTQFLIDLLTTAFKMMKKMSEKGLEGMDSLVQVLAKQHGGKCESMMKEARRLGLVTNQDGFVLKEVNDLFSNKKWAEGVNKVRGLIQERGLSSTLALDSQEKSLIQTYWQSIFKQLLQTEHCKEILTILETIEQKCPQDVSKEPYQLELQQLFHGIARKKIGSKTAGDLSAILRLGLKWSFIIDKEKLELFEQQMVESFIAEENYVSLVAFFDQNPSLIDFAIAITFAKEEERFLQVYTEFLKLYTRDDIGFPLMMTKLLVVLEKLLSMQGTPKQINKRKELCGVFFQKAASLKQEWLTLEFCQAWRRVFGLYKITANKKEYAEIEKKVLFSEQLICLKSAQTAEISHFWQNLQQSLKQFTINERDFNSLILALFTLLKEKHGAANSNADKDLICKVAVEFMQCDLFKKNVRAENQKIHIQSQLLSLHLDVYEMSAKEELLFDTLQLAIEYLTTPNASDDVAKRKIANATKKQVENEMIRKIEEAAKKIADEKAQSKVEEAAKRREVYLKVLCSAARSTDEQVLSAFEALWVKVVQTKLYDHQPHSRMEMLYHINMAYLSSESMKSNVANRKIWEHFKTAGVGGADFLFDWIVARIGILNDRKRADEFVFLCKDFILATTLKVELGNKKLFFKCLDDMVARVIASNNELQCSFLMSVLISINIPAEMVDLYRFYILKKSLEKDYHAIFGVVLGHLIFVEMDNGVSANSKLKLSGVNSITLQELQHPEHQLVFKHASNAFTQLCPFFAGTKTPFPNIENLETHCETMAATVLAQCFETFIGVKVGDCINLPQEGLQKVISDLLGALERFLKHPWIESNKGLLKRSIDDILSFCFRLTLRHEDPFFSQGLCKSFWTPIFTGEHDFDGHSEYLVLIYIGVLESQWASKKDDEMVMTLEVSFKKNIFTVERCYYLRSICSDWLLRESVLNETDRKMGWKIWEVILTSSPMDMKTKTALFYGWMRACIKNAQRKDAVLVWVLERVHQYESRLIIDEQYADTMRFIRMSAAAPEKLKEHYQLMLLEKK